VQNGHKLYWDVDFSDPELSNIESQRFLISDTPGSRRSISYSHGYAFELNLTSNSPALMSSASTIAEQWLEGTRVSCRDMNVQNTSVIHIVQGISVNILHLSNNNMIITKMFNVHAH
jgi:hypothetical protein